MQGIATGYPEVSLERDGNKTLVEVTYEGFDLGEGLTPEALAPKQRHLGQVTRILQRTTPPGLLLKRVTIIQTQGNISPGAGFRLAVKGEAQCTGAKWRASYRWVPTRISLDSDGRMDPSNSIWAGMDPGSLAFCAHGRLIRTSEEQESPKVEDIT